MWTFRYFLNGNTGMVPDAVQSMTTISRAPSVREARQQPLAVFAPSSVQSLRSMSMDTAANMFWMSARKDASSPAVTEPPAISLSWEVPAGAVAPTSVNGFGRTTSSNSIAWEQRTGFDRLVGVASTLRESPITCATTSLTQGAHAQRPGALFLIVPPVQPGCPCRTSPSRPEHKAVLSGSQSTAASFRF